MALLPGRLVKSLSFQALYTLLPSFATASPIEGADPFCAKDQRGHDAFYNSHPRGIIMANKNTYEFTYILNPVLNAEQLKDIVGRVNKYIEEHGGNILEVDEWGTRRLAYPINKKRNGYYVNMYFEAEGTIIARLERALEIDDSVLRYLTLRMDKKMLQHYHDRKSSAPAAADAEPEAAVEG